MKLLSKIAVKTVEIIGVVLILVVIVKLAKTFPPTSTTVISLDRRIQTSTFLIRNQFTGGTAINLKPGIALTAAHVCTDFKIQPAKALDYFGQWHAITEMIIDDQPVSDLCIIKYAEPSAFIPNNEIAEANTALIGDIGITGGYSGGHIYTERAGLIKTNELVKDENLVTSEVFTFNVNVIGGASGSGVFNRHGYIIGILSCGSKEKGGGAVPLSYLRQFLSKQGLL